ncbi:Cof-type HAD-IIB family hydrolase [Clostridium thermarum]|uniref:Cof-type HAD-IIB family hydrolase n=1 Tax=Clostridium thermarum TaxID=1716543 RepID=UPI0011211BB1|nr:Cof-type HAD-IIB family hydrolase [Clostridium thermarum]
MKYKLIAADMDGTLLNSDGKITDKTRVAIGKAVEKGVIFSICTGRPIQGAESFNSLLNLDSPFITYNGAMIVMGKSKKILFQQNLTAEAARNILSIGKEFETTIVAWSMNKLYCYKLSEEIHDYKQITKVEPRLIEDEEELIKNGITKILWIDSPEKLTYYQEVLKDRLGDSVNYCTSRPMFLEFFHNKVSKAVAMEKLGEHFNIKREEMIAIGDGFNDLPMIEYAGLGVAMGNAPADIKARADYVTLSNDKDGIAHVLEKFVL